MSSSGASMRISSGWISDWTIPRIPARSPRGRSSCVLGWEAFNGGVRKRSFPIAKKDPPAKAGSPIEFFESYTAPLFVWILVQLLALVIAATRVKLWARFGSVGESHALDALI